MAEVLARAKESHQLLLEAGGSATLNNKQRLAWKRARGIDTTFEERRLSLRRDVG